jgi:hypothetical protein
MTDETYAHKDRLDLVKRFFAVAVSVGFAGRIIGLERACASPFDQREAIGRLIIGLIAVILFWDWYHRDVERRKYRCVPRFILDVLITFECMLFLYSSDHNTVWLSFLALIFVSFVLWDILAIIEWPSRYGAVPPPANVDDEPLGGPKAIVGTYCGGVFRPSDENRAPFINLCWTGYFVALWLLSAWLKVSTGSSAVLACVFVLVGVAALRIDGDYDLAKTRGLRRVLVILGLLFTYAVARWLFA